MAQWSDRVCGLGTVVRLRVCGLGTVVGRKFRGAAKAEINTHTDLQGQRLRVSGLSSVIVSS